MDSLPLPLGELSCRRLGIPATLLPSCRRNRNGEPTAACNTKPARSRSDSGSGGGDAVGRGLDPYVDTRCVDVTFARTWRDGNDVLVESRLPRDHPLSSGTTRSRVGVTTSHRLRGTSPFGDRATARLVRETITNEMNETFLVLDRDHKENPSRGGRRIVALDDDAGVRLCGIPRADWQPRRGVPVVAANVCVNLRMCTCMCVVSACARLHTHT